MIAVNNPRPSPMSTEANWTFSLVHQILVTNCETSLLSKTSILWRYTQAGFAPGWYTRTLASSPYTKLHTSKVRMDEVPIPFLFSLIILKIYYRYR